MSYDQVAGASSGDDAFLGGASQGGRGIRKVVKWTFELRTEFATSFKFRKVFARQNGFVNCWQPLLNFRKLILGL